MIKDLWKEKFDQILQWAKKENPYLDLREGTAYYDFFKALSLVYVPLMNEIEKLKNNFDITNTSIADDIYTVLMKNLFIHRIEGLRAVGTVRMYFIEPETVEITTDVVFLTKDGLKFYPVTNITISREEMAQNYENELFYIDVPVQAENVGRKYNIKQGEIIEVTNYVNDNLVRVQNLVDFTGGVDYETNEQLFARAKDSISQRSMVTPRGYHHTLFAKVPTLHRIQVIGYNEPEMQRDIVEVNGDLLHVGGKIDVYVKGMQKNIETYVITEAPKEILLHNLPDFKLPLVYVDKIVLVDPITHEELDYVFQSDDYSLISEDNILNFSTQQKIKFVLNNDSLIGSSFKIYYYTPKEASLIQQILLNDEERIVNADPLVYSFIPALVYVFLSIKTNVSFNEEHAQKLKDEIEQYIESIPTFYKRTSLLPAEATEYNRLHISDIINIAYKYPITAVLNMQVYTQMFYKDFSSNTINLNLSSSQPDIQLPRCYQFFVKEITINYRKTTG